jgi:hypothetical protein
MLLCLAALEAPLQLSLDGSVYGEDIVFIANGVIPSFTKQDFLA